jgi:purine-binding chemotaxis protein CheW
LPGGGWFHLRGGTGHPLDIPPRAPQPAAMPGMPDAAPRRPRRATGLQALHLSLGGVALAVPAALAEHIHPMPALLPLPGAPPGVIGMAIAGGQPLLVLDTARAAGSTYEPDATPAFLLALRVSGRRVGLPAGRIAAGPTVPALRMFQAWLASAETRLALAHAPPALEEAAPRVLDERHLVLFRAAGMTVALPAEAVRAVLPPTRPLHLPGASGYAGLAAHRGAVLPVRDAGLRLGGAAVLGAGAAPMIRLALNPEVLLAVSHIVGVRRLPSADVTPLGAGEGLAVGLARMQGQVVVVLSSVRLGA